MCQPCKSKKTSKILTHKYENILSTIRVAESVVTLLRRNEPSKDLVSQSLSSKLTCEREMAQKALELLLTAQNAFEREREISSQGS